MPNEQQSVLQILVKMIVEISFQRKISEKST